MSNIETFTQKQQEKEINDAHEIGLHAEKTSRVIARQALSMVNKGQISAVAKRRFMENINPGRFFGEGVSPKHDSHSIELATNAALSEKGVEVEVTEPVFDPIDFVRTRAKLNIKKIDGVPIDTE